MSIERGAPEPLYQQLAAILRGQIQRGELAPRTMIPSITQLAATYDLAEVTVRKACEVLKNEQLLVAVPGRGTFISRKG